MKNFSSFVKESQSKGLVNNKVTSAEIDNYLDKTKSLLPSIAKDIIVLTKKCGLWSAADIETVKNAAKASLHNIAYRFKAPEDSMMELWNMIRVNKKFIPLLPQYQTIAERNTIEKGKVKLEDILIDLETPQGQAEAVKRYMPVVMKIINQYDGKSRLSRSDLISAADEAFAETMHDWDRTKGQSFPSYLAYRISQKLRNEMDQNGHTLSGTNWYATKKAREGSDISYALLDAISIGGSNNDDPDKDFDDDRIAALGEWDNAMNDDEVASLWDQLFALLEKNFKTRDIDILYRYLGAKGYQKMKSKDIAKMYGMSIGNIRNSIINKILTFLKKDKRAIEISSSLRDLYTEGLMIELFGKDKEFIVEALADDDMYILLEEASRWSNKKVFTTALYDSLQHLKKDEVKYIIDILEKDFNELDNTFKKNKITIINFLSYMYPTESMARKTDVSLLEYMTELQEVYKKYAKK